MKKLLALLLALVMVMALAACGSQTEEPSNESKEETTTVPEETTTEATEEETTTEEPEVAVMTYEEYLAAEIDDDVVVEFAVQDTQGWWDNKIVVYGADEDGAYLVYNMACSEEDAAKLTEGTWIRVTGYKTEFSGQVEVAEGATFEFIEKEAFVSERVDVTDKLGTEELADYMTQKVSFTGMTVEEITFKNDGGDDIYVAVSKDGNTYNFCVEVYLTGTETEVYTTVSGLEKGAVIDIEGFLYWYEGPNTHITAVTVAE